MKLFFNKGKESSKANSSAKVYCWNSEMLTDSEDFSSNDNLQIKLTSYEIVQHIKDTIFTNSWKTKFKGESVRLNGELQAIPLGVKYMLDLIDATEKKYTSIHLSEWTECLNAIKFTANQFLLYPPFFNNRNKETEKFYQEIAFSMEEIKDYIANIKNLIRSNDWNVGYGGHTLRIDEAKVKFPDGIHKIWKLIEKEDSSQVYWNKIFVKIKEIARAHLNKPHHFSHQDRQTKIFYQEILSTFPVIKDKIKEDLSLQKKSFT